jgi:hypothetical protein
VIKFIYGLTAFIGCVALCVMAIIAGGKLMLMFLDAIDKHGPFFGFAVAALVFCACLGILYIIDLLGLTPPLKEKEEKK